MSQIGLSCFKAYDLRGRVPDELNPELAHKIGQSFAAILQPKTVVVGHDIRLSSPELSDSLIRGLRSFSVNVIDIGLCGTEEIYFATAHLNCDGGIMVTASHNPADYNGMKLVREKSIPLTGEDLLADMERMIVTHQIPEAIGIEGNLTKLDNRPAYIEKLLSFIDVTKLKPLKVVCNPGNGCAGPTMRALENHLPLKLDFIHETPDGTFPHGVPNPLLSENRHITAARVRETGADLAIAWDGDFDRCFFFDETGRFVEGYYLVALLARTILRHHPGQKIIHDPRLYWNTNDVVCCAGGEAIMSRTGHAFIKQTMRKEDAIYGGEMSAHHYFRDFSYCDSGMIPWLLVVEEISRSGKPLSRLVNEMIANYPVSGEINRRVEDAKAVVAKVREHFEDEKISEDQTDGLSFEMKNWRFNLRSSNTEPLLRLNVESRKDRMLMEERTAEILKIIDA